MRGNGVSKSLGAAVVLVAASLPGVVSAQAGQTTCGEVPAGYNVIESNAAVITGTSGKDFICAGDADNRILAGGGGDIVFGGAGNDHIYGEAGADELHGGDGRDRLYGGVSPDRLYGERANDILKGGKGDDLLVGGSGRDRIFGQVGDDVLKGKAGRDRIFGGDGIDVADGGNDIDECSDALFPSYCEQLHGRVEIAPNAEHVGQWTIADVAATDNGTHIAMIRQDATSDASDRDIELVMRDMATNEIRVLVNDLGVFASDLAISADGRLVAFITAEALVAEDTNSTTDAYIVNTKTKAVARMSVGTNGEQAGAIEVTMSADGRYVAFTSNHTTLSPLVTQRRAQAYVRDRLANTTSLVSITADGVPADGSVVEDLAVTNTGLVSFATDAANFEAFSSWKKSAIHDLSTGTTAPLDLYPDHHGQLHMSANGKVMLLESMRYSWQWEWSAGLMDPETGVVNRLSTECNSDETIDCSIGIAAFNEGALMLEVEGISGLPVGAIATFVDLDGNITGSIETDVGFTLPFHVSHDGSAVAYVEMDQVGGDQEVFLWYR